jgi:tRNA pseudouridine38-40 synthase
VPRYALAVEYDGTEYLGWQTQNQQPTLQETLEAAISLVANEPVKIVCSGRTDAGVHASGQIVHFDCVANRDPRSFMLGANAHLPKTMAVYWAKIVEPDFHARYSALAREYCYQLINRQARPGVRSRFLAWERFPLDVHAMQQAANYVLGEQDFTSFRTVACQAKRPWRRLDRLDISRESDVVSFRVQANAFLHHMVRNLVGSLLVVGRKEQPPEWMHEVLIARDRTLAGPTAPAGGLEFIGAKYPRTLEFPEIFCADDALISWRPNYMSADESDDAD